MTAALRPAAWLVGVLLVLATAVTVRSEATSTWAGSSPLVWALDVLTAATLVTAAVTARRLRTPAVTWAAGTLWLLPDLAGVPTISPTVATLAEASGWLLPGLLVTTLHSANGRRPVRSTALVAAGSLVGAAGRVLATNPFLQVDCWRECRHNPLAWGEGTQLQPWLAWIAAGLIGTGLVATLRTRQRTTPAAVAWTAAVGTVALLGPLCLPNGGPSSVWPLAAHAAAAGSALVLAAWLLAGEAQDRRLRRRLTLLAIDLQHAPAPGHFAEALATALTDPSVQVRYYVADEGTYVDSQGHPVPALGQDSDQLTTVTRSGSPLALVYQRRADPARILRAIGPSMRLALQNDQLRAARLAELRDVDQSRRRILEQAHQERRRLERNLHDGAQQRVVTLLLMLRLLARHVPDAYAAEVERAAEETGQLLHELRRLARGIHPAAVADSGLTGALGDLAESSNDVPVTVQIPATLPLSALAQSTAYEVIAAAVAHARAQGAIHAHIHATTTTARVTLQIDHDAPEPQPSGDLDRLAMQVEALAGSLHSDGLPGHWQLRMELPCES